MSYIILLSATARIFINVRVCIRQGYTDDVLLHAGRLHNQPFPPCSDFTEPFIALECVINIQHFDERCMLDSSLLSAGSDLGLTLGLCVSWALLHMQPAPHSLHHFTRIRTATSAVSLFIIFLTLLRLCVLFTFPFFFLFHVAFYYFGFSLSASTPPFRLVSSYTTYSLFQIFTQFLFSFLVSP